MTESAYIVPVGALTKPKAPTEQFHCVPFNADISARTCIARHTTEVVSPRSRRPMYHQCASCEVGKHHLREYGRQGRIAPQQVILLPTPVPQEQPPALHSTRKCVRDECGREFKYGAVKALPRAAWLFCPDCRNKVYASIYAHGRPPRWAIESDWPDDTWGWKRGASEKLAEDAVPTPTPADEPIPESQEENEEESQIDNASDLFRLCASDGKLLWSNFAEWCSRKGLDFLPASKQCVGLYCEELKKTMTKIEIQRVLLVIRRVHNNYQKIQGHRSINPCTHKNITAWLKGHLAYKSKGVLMANEPSVREKIVRNSPRTRVGVMREIGPVLSLAESLGRYKDQGILVWFLRDLIDAKLCTAEQMRAVIDGLVKELQEASGT